MTGRILLWRSLTHFWRTNLAVVVGVAVAVSVLAGALLVGASVRGSLRDIALQRLGQVDHVVTIRAESCSCCGESLAGLAAHGKLMRHQLGIKTTPGQ